MVLLIFFSLFCYSIRILSEVTFDSRSTVQIIITIRETRILLNESQCNFCIEGLNWINLIKRDSIWNDHFFQDPDTHDQTHGTILCSLFIILGPRTNWLCVPKWILQERCKFPQNINHESDHQTIRFIGFHASYHS